MNFWGLIQLVFLSRNYHLIVSFGEKAKIKKAGNLNKGHSYVTTTVWLNIEAIPKSDIKFVIKSDIKFDISIKPTTWIGQMKRNLKEENWTKLNFLSKAKKKVSKY